MNIISEKTQTVEPPYKIPRKRPLFETDPADKALGEERDLKFKAENITILKRFLNSDMLLERECDDLVKNFEKLMLNSSTTSTWKKHNSAWNSYAKFCDNYNICFRLPISIENMRSYVTWATTVNNLQASTVESYMSSLNLAHTLANVHCTNFSKDRCITLLLKGATNTMHLHSEAKTLRLAMNIHLLRILSHRIYETDWHPISKQIVWTASTVSFYSSCRMGEILSESKTHYDPKTTLKWGDIIFLPENELIVQVPYTKTTGLMGSSLNLFSIECNTCPVAALQTLYSMCNKENMLSENKPVFQFKTGVNLTTKTMNTILDNLLQDFNNEKHKISCHSFRAAIPSVIASHPDKVSKTEVQEWGKWRSESYKKYTKMDRDKDRIMFYKAVNML